MRRTLQNLLDTFAALFVESRPSGVYSRGHVLVLLSIIAGAVVVRFWGLGSVGLHGDEETMALAVQSILRDGTPHLPSGMLYPRGLAQLYLMAASVWAFGETEWALRLPSALCGLGVIWLALVIGRRFLKPEWNLALAAAVAFLPEFIVYSQTARMYIFLLASLAAMLWCVLEWERAARVRFLVAAVALFAVGVHFHALMVVSAPILLYPALLHGEMRKFWQSVIALAICAALFMLINDWTEAQYAGLPSLDNEQAGLSNLQNAVQALRPKGPMLFAAAAVILFMAWTAVRHISAPVVRWIAAALLVLGLAAQLALQYHAAAILLLAFIVLMLRNARKPVMNLAMLLLASGGLLATHMLLFIQLGVQSGRQILAGIIGVPSLWPYVQASVFSKVAFGIAVIGFVAALWRLARRRRVEDYWLLFVLAAAVPLMTIGVIRWNVPPRYTVGVVLPYLICAIAALQDVLQRFVARQSTVGARRASAVGAILAGIAVTNPVAAGRVINAGYSLYPDHKGAAEFVKSLNLTPDDVVLAEDHLQQTYYLGAVDYWLISWNTARFYMRNVDGKTLDIYTGTPVMSSARELEKFLSTKKHGRVFIVGSGENKSDGRRLMRSDGLFELLQSDQVQPLYRGRDGFTQVWQVRQSTAMAANGAKRKAR